MGKPWEARDRAKSTLMPPVLPAEVPCANPKLRSEFDPLAAFPHFHRADDEG